MPLHIDIRVNDSLINTLHIGRFSGGTDPDDNNIYLIVDGKKPTNLDDWVMRGTEFRHRYGDGAEVCVMKGIQAIKGEWPREIFEQHPPQGFRDKSNGE